MMDVRSWDNKRIQQGALCSLVHIFLPQYSKRSTYNFCFTSSCVPKRANSMEDLLTREIEAVGDDNVAEVRGPSPCSPDSRLQASASSL